MANFSIKRKKNIKLKIRIAAKK